MIIFKVIVDWTSSMVVESYLAVSGPNFELLHAPQILPGYFRSKLFMSTNTSNPFVAAASPLLSLLERLCTSNTLPAVEDMRDQIDHELLAFQSRFLGQTGTHEQVAMSYYLLSATIDELLGKNYLRLHGQPAEFKSFTPASGSEDCAPQHQFFTLIQHIKERAHQYLSVIELAYYCLIAGFEGYHHFRADGRQTLDNLIEELHQLIQQHRVHKPYRPFITNPITQIPVHPHKKLLILGVLMSSLLAAAYISSQTLIERHAQQLLQTLHPVVG